MQQDTSDFTETPAGLVQAEEQTFRHWSSQRLALYQEMEHQLQSGIEQLLQLGNQYVVRLEDETSNALNAYREQRASYRQEIETTRQELAQLRDAFEHERQALMAEREQERTQHEARLVFTRQQAQDEAQRILAEARAERERVVEETRLLSERLHGLQQMLRDMLGSAVLAATPAATPSRAPDYPLPTAPVAPLATTQPVATTNGVPAHPIPAQPLGSAAGIVANSDAVGLPPLATITVCFHDIDSFVVASEIIDALAILLPDGNPTIVSYEQKILQLSLYAPPEQSILSILRDRFANQFFVQQEAEQLIKLYRR